MVEKNQLRSRQRRGALTLEWILLVTVLVIGIIGGMAATVLLSEEVLPR
jgi:flagellar basal body-associated protein FliL